MLRHHRLFCFQILTTLTCLTSVSGSSKSLSSVLQNYGNDGYEGDGASVLDLLRQSFNKLLSKRWRVANEMALLEQQVEDYNAQWIASASSPAQATRHRRLIAMPLSPVFDPPMGAFSHGHVETGDKVSIPYDLWRAISLNEAEVPWLFQISRIDGDAESEDGDNGSASASASSYGLLTPPRVQFCDDVDPSPIKVPNTGVITNVIPAERELTSVTAGILDYRAPSTHIFMPAWMMRALGIRPGEVVDVTLATQTPPGSMVRLRPHSKRFALDISHPQAVMETELRHYSSLTRGSTIAMDYNNRRYWFDVVDCRSAPKGESVPFIKVQDCDIASDFLTDRETLRELALKKQKRKEEQEEQ